MRGRVSKKDFPCCIPGCHRYTLRRSNKLCKYCWQEYGGKKTDRPEWLNYLMLAGEREYYAQERDEKKLASYEQMINQGQLNTDTVEIFRGPQEGPKKQRHKRKRGRPKKCVETTITAPIRTQTSISLTR